MAATRIEIEKFAALSQCWLLGTVGQKAEVTDTHETIGQDVKQEAADEFLGLQRYRLFAIAVPDLDSSR